MWLDTQALPSEWLGVEREEEGERACSNKPEWEEEPEGEDLGEERSGVNDWQEAVVLCPGSPDAQDPPSW